MYFDYSQSGENSDSLAITHNNYVTFDNVFIVGMSKGMVLAGKNLTIKNSTVQNTHGASQQNGVWINAGANNFLVENNLFDDNGNSTHGHSIYFSSGENGIIRNNIFTDSDVSTIGGAAFQFHSETWYSPIQNWEISENTFENNPTMAIQLQPESEGAGAPWNQIISDIIIEKNTFKNNKYVMQLEGNKNVTFQNNIIVGNKDYVSFYISNELNKRNSSLAAVENLIIQNNDFYNNNNNRIISWEFNGGDFTFQNNIVFEEVLNKNTIYRDSNPDSEIWRNNIYYIPNYSTTISEPGSTDYGTSEPSPLFVDAGTDFHLTTDSVAIDQGYANGLVEDFDGTFRPQAGAIDVGAYEAIPEPFLFVVYYLSFIIYYRKKL